MEHGEIMILPIDTIDQCADYLTKGMAMELFEAHWKANQ